MLTDDPRAGRIRTRVPPIRFSETPGSIRTPAPTLGEHTGVVLGEAGITPEELTHLKGLKVIA